MEKDCIFLLADGQMDQTFRGFLSRDGCHRSLGTRSFTFDTIIDRQNGDSGVYTRGHEFLRQYRNTHQYAIAVLDHDWQGAPSVMAIQTHLKNKLTSNGWREDNIEVIVIEPELEIWLWQDAPYMAEILRFTHQPHNTLRKWLEERGLWLSTDLKPARPKEAFQAVQHSSRRPYSGATYAQIAQRISVSHCQDAAFCLLRDTLQRWFPANGGQP